MAIKCTVTHCVYCLNNSNPSLIGACFVGRPHLHPLGRDNDRSGRQGRIRRLRSRSHAERPRLRELRVLRPPVLCPRRRRDRRSMSVRTVPPSPGGGTRGADHCDIGKPTTHGARSRGVAALRFPGVVNLNQKKARQSPKQVRRARYLIAINRKCVCGLRRPRQSD